MAINKNLQFVRSTLNNMSIICYIRWKFGLFVKISVEIKIILYICVLKNSYETACKYLSIIAETNINKELCCEIKLIIIVKYE